MPDAYDVARRCRLLQEQVRRIIDREITEGEFGPGAQLPTEKDYADRLGVSLITVRSALASLVQAGRVERASGRGTFVAPDRVPYEIKLMSSATGSLRAAGVLFDVEVATAEAAQPPRDVAASLRLRRGAKAFHLVRVVSISATPAIVLDSWLRRTVAGHLADAETRLADGSSLYALLAEHGVTVARAEGRVELAYADDHDAKLLRLAYGTPLFCYSSDAIDYDGTPIERARALYDAARFALTISPDLAKMTGRVPADLVDAWSAGRGDAAFDWARSGAVSRVRDLVLTRQGELLTVIACDSNAGIGDQSHDVIRQSARATGISAAKVPLMEVLAAGATPVIVVNTLGCAFNGAGSEIVAGIAACMQASGHRPVITGSDETNVRTSQTSVGVTVIGVVDRAGLRLGTAGSGDAVVVIGTPMDGFDVPYDEEDPQVVTAHDVAVLARSHDLVHEVLPVGSRGVRYEAGELARTAGLSFTELPTAIDMTRSAGSSTCVLVACDPERVENLGALVSQQLTVVGSVD